MTSAWTPATASPDVTFDATPSATTTIPVGGSTEWDSWDLTTLVKSWAAGTVPNYGLLLKRSTEPTDAGGPSFASNQDATTQPKLDVLWASDAVLFPTPQILHANGAELRWERFDGSTGATFDRYEIHRSQTANFTPSASTLIATIRDVNTLTYRDTTAAPGQTFSYQIVTNGTAASVEQRVTLPPVGTATMTLQPDNLTGKDTVLVTNSEYGNDCGDYGGSPDLYAGTADILTRRSLLRFDVSDIPAASRINNATLSLYANTLPGTATTVQARAITSDWQTSTSMGSCGTGGADWTQASSGHDWLQPGGDYGSTVVASKSDAPTDQPGWDPFDITTLAQQWVNGTAANFGVLLKAADETVANGQVEYESSDSATDTVLRPKLVVSYAEPAQVNGPQVAISSPVSGAVLSDTQTITATASDDSRVAGVDFYVDGVLQGSDSIRRTATPGRPSRSRTASTPCQPGQPTTPAT